MAYRHLLGYWKCCEFLDWDRAFMGIYTDIFTKTYQVVHIRFGDFTVCMFYFHTIYIICTQYILDTVCTQFMLVASLELSTPANFTAEKWDLLRIVAWSLHLYPHPVSSIVLTLKDIC